MAPFTRQFIHDELEGLKSGKKKGPSNLKQLDDALLQRVKKLAQRLRPARAALHMSWEDLIDAEARGRWWRAGASWAGAGQRAEPQAKRAKGGAPAQPEEGGAKGGASDGTLAAKAATLRMNTETRRSVFSAIMGAEGVEDALQRLAALSLKGPHAREPIRVLVECCGGERTYNPFYAALAKRLCKQDSEHRFTAQLTFYDAFKTFAAMPPRRAANLAALLGALVLHDALSLAAVLKHVDLAALEPTALLFFRALLHALLAPAPVGDDPLTKVCARLGASKDALAARDQLVVFLAHHVAAPPGHEAIFPERRREFKRMLRDAQALHKAMHKASAKSDEPADEWAAYFTK